MINILNGYQNLIIEDKLSFFQFFQKLQIFDCSL